MLHTEWFFFDYLSAAAMT